MDSLKTLKRIPITPKVPEGVINPNTSDFYVMALGRVYAKEATIMGAITKAKSLSREYGIRFNITRKNAK